MKPISRRQRLKRTRRERRAALKTQRLVDYAMNAVMKRSPFMAIVLNRFGDASPIFPFRP
jgi:hypothetical protein